MPALQLIERKLMPALAARFKRGLRTAHTVSPSSTMAGWSKLTQVELRALLQVLGQPTGGSKAALVQCVTAFMTSDDVGDDSEAPGEKVESEAAGGPSAPEAAELEAAGARIELNAWRAATARLDELATSLAQQRAHVRAAQLAEAQVKAACAQQRATVKAAAATAIAALHPHRVRHNEQTCQLLQLVAHDDLRLIFMRAEVWGVVGLWKLRSVCRAFRGWAQAELSSLPRVVAVGGLVKERPKYFATASVESLDLSTMRWSMTGCMPALPNPRAWHSVSCSAEGRVVVCCGYNQGGADPMHHLGSTALQWLPGTGAWSALPDLSAGRAGAASVRLPDGRTMLIGGASGGQTLASVAVLAADGSGWSDLPPLTGVRYGAAAALLPDGKVLVAGGKTTRAPHTALKTAELWDPAKQNWTALPPMAHERWCAATCMLPSGRVAVVGGVGTDGYIRKDGEVFDLVKHEWEPLGAHDIDMEQHKHRNIISATAVAGGLIAVGGRAKPELYQEECGRWFSLPRRTRQPRANVELVSVPATEAR
eukprot:COSAG06_NODE_3303_length_5532_cov_4.124425_2_plen_538_part_00